MEWVYHLNFRFLITCTRTSIFSFRNFYLYWWTLDTMTAVLLQPCDLSLSEGLTHLMVPVTRRADRSSRTTEGYNCLWFCLLKHKDYVILKKNKSFNDCSCYLYYPCQYPFKSFWTLKVIFLLWVTQAYYLHKENIFYYQWNHFNFWLVLCSEQKWQWATEKDAQISLGALATAAHTVLPNSLHHICQLYQVPQEFFSLS